jgi:hypothetical protein
MSASRTRPTCCNHKPATTPRGPTGSSRSARWTMPSKR